MTSSLCLQLKKALHIPRGIVTTTMLPIMVWSLMSRKTCLNISGTRLLPIVSACVPAFSFSGWHFFLTPEEPPKERLPLLLSRAGPAVSIE